MKNFDFGSLYRVPWKLEASTSEPYGCVVIPDRSYVVVLDMTEESRHLMYSTTPKYEFKLKLLTLDGRICYMVQTRAALDYWKPAPTKELENGK